MKNINAGKTFGGILLVSGTTIGGAVLALPISTGLTGFFPSLALFVGCWLYLFYTSLLILEATLWVKGETNLISLAKETLGRSGKGFCWIFYLFLLYSLNTAYIALTGDLSYRLLGNILPYWAAAIPSLLIFGAIVYRGIRSIDQINRVFMIGLTLSYVALIALVTPHVEIEKLEYVDWSYASIAISVTVTAFGYHVIIPSLTTYLHYNVSKLKKSLIIGSLIPLFLYIIWEFAILGVLPIEGVNGIASANQLGKPATELLGTYLNNSLIVLLARFFEICAVITSFLGVSLSLSDFFADGLHIKKTTWGKLLLSVLTLGPPFCITLINPRAFLAGLEYAGVFGVVVLLGLFPALMVWQGRYRLKKEGEYRAPGGKAALIAVMALSIGFISLEIYQQLQHLVKISSS